jgi:hypothetical protein
VRRTASSLLEPADLDFVSRRNPVIHRHRITQGHAAGYNHVRRNSEKFFHFFVLVQTLDGEADPAGAESEGMSGQHSVREGYGRIEQR